VQYQRRVTRVLHARGTAVGVQDGDGTRIHARYAVIADVPAPALYRDLVGVDALPRRFVDDLRNFQWDNAILKINWALSRPVPWTASGVRGAGTVHLGGDLDGLSTYGAALSRRDLPDLPFVIVGQMTTSDPSRSPAGTESMWAYTHVPQQLADQDDQLRRQADRMQQLIEGHAPGFTASILARHIQFPADLQAHNPSLRGGALNAGTAALQQQLIFRPVVGLARADTPVDRLYLASASAHPGGGVHGAPGANAARAALARNGYGGGAYRRLVQGAHRRLYRDDADPA
jgi:phytoene dehydrogenase-like protein